MRYFAVLLALALVVPAAFGQSLQQAYNAAPAGEGYDKLLILDPKVTYTGGCSVVQGKTSCIRGNGALCNLDGGNIFVTQPKTHLDITACCLYGGGYMGAIYVADEGSANIDGNTICKSGIGIYVWAYSTATVKNNVIFDNNKTGCYNYGIAKHQYTTSLSILYNDVHQHNGGNYKYFCPG